MFAQSHNLTNFLTHFVSRSFDAAAPFSFDAARKTFRKIGQWSRFLATVREQKIISIRDYQQNCAGISSQPVVNATDQWNLQPSIQVSQPVSSYYTPSVPNLPLSRPPVPLFHQSCVPNNPKPSYEPMGPYRGFQGPIPQARPNLAFPTAHGSGFGSNLFSGNLSPAAAPASASAGVFASVTNSSSNAGTVTAVGGGGGGWVKPAGAKPVADNILGTASITPTASNGSNSTISGSSLKLSISGPGWGPKK